jgi:four helix bundle protein
MKKTERTARNIQHPTSNIQHPTSNGEEFVPGEAANEVWELNDGHADGRKFDLEERLLEFASAIIDLSERLPNTRAGNHIAGQILRSGTSPYPNHGEAEDAESRDDFVHKLKVCQKELRETRRWARLVRRKGWAAEDPTLVFVLGESEQLIRIFHSSIKTARRNALVQQQAPSVPRRPLPTEAR